MREAMIVLARRTPVGRVGGALSTLEPEKLLAPLLSAILSTIPVPPSFIDDVIIGNVVGPGGNIGRLAALESGLPVSVPGMTIDRQCGSGLEAINLAARLIQSGAGEVYLAGGVESVSRAPWKMTKPDTLTGTPSVYTRARFTPECYGDPDMGIAAEQVARTYNISRTEQDEYALNSHRKAIHAQLTGRFEQEIVPLDIQGEKISADECPRAATSLKQLEKLKPVFAENGTVTAGNACPINDGAALVLLMSSDLCRRMKLRPVMKWMDAQVSGVDPQLLGIGAVPAVRTLLERHQLTASDLDYMEFNEAFASQTLASLRLLHIPENRVNRAGGALALGHPYGASGAILITRLYAEMLHQPFQRGIAAMGIGGGMGVAALVEAVEWKN